MVKGRKQLPRTRKFDGEVFARGATYRLKSDAKKRAENMRKRGWKVRLVPRTGGGTVLYKRKRR